MKTKEYTLTLPLSAEPLGKWLEVNHARLEISCNLAVYHVTITKHRHEKYSERGHSSRRQSSEVEFSCYGKDLESTLSQALEAAKGDPS